MDTGNSYGRTKYLFFYVGGGLYAIEALKTFGVYEITSLTHMVQAGAYMIGITSLKEYIWPVIDLKIWLYGKKTSRNKSGKLLTVAIDDGEHKFLAVIEAVVSTADICANMILPTDKSHQASYIRTFINTGDMTAGVLSMEKLFDT